MFEEQGSASQGNYSCKVLLKGLNRQRFPLVFIDGTRGEDIEWITLSFVKPSMKTPTVSPPFQSHTMNCRSAYFAELKALAWGRAIVP
ncbi:MAG: hypothetical protein BMS9Abin28_1400 [Anaerolineae bacterium]|nr:MAG: hypothetical protein BMS9Abin28_1400 [Anaerolineae bacterium]